MNGAAPHQPKACVDAHVVVVFRVEAPHPGDLVEVFTHMGLHVHTRRRGDQDLCRFEALREESRQELEAQAAEADMLEALTSTQQTDCQMTNEVIV